MSENFQVGNLKSAGCSCNWKLTEKIAKDTEMTWMAHKLTQNCSQAKTSLENFTDIFGAAPIFCFRRLASHDSGLTTVRRLHTASHAESLSLFKSNQTKQGNGRTGSTPNADVRQSTSQTGCSCSRLGGTFSTVNIPRKYGLAITGIHCPRLIQ